jgi:hypothetical protein
MAGWKNVQFADLWRTEYGKLQAAGMQLQTPFTREGLRRSRRQSGLSKKFGLELWFTV